MDESGRIKRATISIRTSEESKQRLAESAEQAGRSLNQEVEFRLEVSLLRDREAGSRSVAALADFMRLAVTAIEQRTGKAWNEDAETYFATRTAFTGFIYRNHPPAPAVQKEIEDAEAAVAEAAKKIEEATGGASFDARAINALVARKPADPALIADYVDKLQREIDALEAMRSLFQRADETAEAASFDLADLLRL